MRHLSKDIWQLFFLDKNNKGGNIFGVSLLLPTDLVVYWNVYAQVSKQTSQCNVGLYIHIHVTPAQTNITKSIVKPTLDVILSP